MVSVYNAENGNVCMTHYCSVDNHPKMNLKSTKDNEMAFETKGSTGLGGKKEMRMHAMTINRKDKDRITEKWTLYNDSKVQGVCNFILARDK